MALTPRIKIALTEFQRDMAETLEARIDGFIKTNFDGGEDSVVRVDISDVSRHYTHSFPKVMNELTKRYTEANWNVHYTYRGGANCGYAKFIELTPKKKRGKE